MKKSILSFIFLFTLSLTYAQWGNNSSGHLVTDQYVRIGDNNNGNYRYNFYQDISTDNTYMSFKNNANIDVLSFKADASSTYLSYKNRLGGELFKVGKLGSDTEMFMHLPQVDSRIVIGAFGNYLQSDGHKLVVKSGSAMIEGNVLTNSNIGIGTSSFVDGSDTYRLSVDGRIRATAVKVYTDWADYVFEDDYKLPTLNEVEDYIKINGHLKDIPSAKEVEENGIELGEMNKLLLQKIEELTLYTIELKKEVEMIKNKID